LVERLSDDEEKYNVCRLGTSAMDTTVLTKLRLSLSASFLVFVAYFVNNDFDVAIKTSPHSISMK